ncbi:unnamed protein product [Meloidogyne enterolobii]|uniref:Uncharacterized protein n=1 Tax=Meloidogyne enterolobii TaxID=390850 RepID=A0ACB0YEY7_MELEN
MKFISVLLLLIFNSILWSIINSVKNNKNKNEMIRVEKPSKNLYKIFNDEAESSVALQLEKYRETLKPNTKITKKQKTENNEEKKLKRKEYMKDYYHQHKKEKQCYNRNYHQNNKKKICESKRKYRLKKKNEREILDKDRSELGNIHDNNEKTSFVSSQNDDFIRKETTGNNENEKKFNRTEYKKNYDQKNKEKIREYNRNYHLKRKYEKGNSQNDNYINKGKSPIECSENVQANNKEGNDNTEGTAFVNPLADDCENNLADTNACPYEQPNVQLPYSPHIQQLDNHDDLIDLSLSDDSYFLDYLNSFPNT